MLNKMTVSDRECIRSLIASIGCKDNANIPEYVQLLFNHLVSEAVHVCISFDILENELLAKKGVDGSHDLYGVPNLKDIYLDKEGMVKWKEIIGFFPRLESIIIQRLQFNRRKVLCPSIKITNLFLQRLSMALAETERKINVHVIRPKNTDSSLQSLSRKFASTFMDIGYTMERRSVEFEDEVDGKIMIPFMRIDVVQNL